MELPEALTIANQINGTLIGKSIANIIAAHIPLQPASPAPVR